MYPRTIALSYADQLVVCRSAPLRNEVPELFTHRCALTDCSLLLLGLLLSWPLCLPLRVLPLRVLHLFSRP